MMPVVTLTDELDRKLRLLITDFGQTREALIAQLIEAEVDRRTESALGDGDDAPATADEELIVLDPDQPANLHFSKIMSASVDGKPINRPNWNKVRQHMHLIGIERLGSLKAVTAAANSNAMQGRYEFDGYRYLSEYDFSLQGSDSNWAWTHSLRLARAMNVPIRVTFRWRDREDAAHPGERGVLEWNPSQ